MLTFRRSLALIVLSGLISLGLVVAISEYIGVQVRDDLTNVEGKLIPKAELGPRVEASVGELSRAFQDAVTAQDLAGLEATEVRRDEILRLLGGLSAAISEAERERIEHDLRQYFDRATVVSTRLIRGDAGEETLAAAAEMQTRYGRLRADIVKTLTLDRKVLAAAFQQARGASIRAAQIRITLGVAGAILLVAFGLWSRRELLLRVDALNAGIARFATGAFTEKIPEGTLDELGLLAREVNKMAEGLAQAAAEQRARDWLRMKLAELSDELRGNLEVETVAERVLAFLSESTGSVASAIYLRDGKSLVLTKSFADSPAHSEFPPRVFGLGEGLLGQATLKGKIESVRDLPPGFFKVRSALGEAPPRELLLFPIHRKDEPIGIVELALLRSPTALERELLTATELLIAVSFESAQARRAADKLHLETQGLADRLIQQEEELRLSNQELLAQQQELRRANDALEDQRESLSERNQELSRARERIQEKVEELGRVSHYKSQFLANMSHELRTPLNSMLLLSRLLADNESRNLTDKQVEWCSTIHSAGQDLLELINQVLDLSKIEAGKAESEIGEVNLKELGLALSRMFEPLAEGRGLKFIVEVCPELSVVSSDRLRVERIITNLLGNAVKFTEAGSVELWIGPPSLRDLPVPAGLTEPLVAFSVKDTGIGIAGSELERVFVPFEQVDSTSARRYQGTGLGLSIARESARLLGGEIVVESELGAGSRFTLFLPVNHASPQPERRAERSRSEIPVDDRAGLSDREPHVLVIEDDPTLAEQLVDAIHSRTLKAVVASTGEEGLRLAEQLRPVGIVLDVKLPDIDGWTVMERLRDHPDTSRIPVHFLSALDAPEGGLSRGAIGYLTKPATREQLREVIRSLAPTSSDTQRILVVEDNALEGSSLLALLEAAGYQAIHVRTGEAAERALEAQRFDCVLLDLGLPDMDGLELLGKLRKLVEFSNTRFVVHTGRLLSASETRHLEDHAQAIVLKDAESGRRLLEEIRLFAHHVRNELDLRDEQPEPEAGPAASEIEGKRILLVEDDIRTVYALSALLQSRGSQVEVAENGREALEVLESRSVDCVLMDIMMPEMDGYEAMRRIRSQPRFKALPIIALTAKAMVGERERCLDAGASDYLSKPVEGAELLGAVARWTGKEGSDATGA